MGRRTSGSGIQYVNDTRGRCAPLCARTQAIANRNILYHIVLPGLPGVVVVIELAHRVLDQVSRGLDVHLHLHAVVLRVL